jgi:hypothetical protein
VEAKGILVISALFNSDEFLPYPEAAIWDLSLKYGLQDGTVDMIRTICRTTEKKAEKLLAKAIENWQIKGFIDIL